MSGLEGRVMKHLGLVMVLVSFGFFGWLIHKYLEKEISGVAAWFVVSLVAILQMGMAATFEALENYIILGLFLMVVSVVMMFVMGAVESRKPWAEEDRVIKKVNDILAPFE
jgi:hypothetical protein